MISLHCLRLLDLLLLDLVDLVGYRTQVPVGTFAYARVTSHSLWGCAYMCDSLAALTPTQRSALDGGNGGLASTT